MRGRLDSEALRSPITFRPIMRMRIELYLAKKCVVDLVYVSLLRGQILHITLPRSYVDKNTLLRSLPCVYILVPRWRCALRHGRGLGSNAAVHVTGKPVLAYIRRCPIPNSSANRLILTQPTARA